MKIVELIAGVAIVAIGVLPYIAKTGFLKQQLQQFQPGTALYQGIIIAIGVLLILYATRARKKREKVVVSE
jgi:multisubunit Na+/H+ antiporter MnhB subunit